MSVILSLDQSTQGTKGLVWSTDGKLLGRADVPHRQIVDENGWVSHDLTEIWKNVRRAAQNAIEAAGVSPSDVAVLGISNQRETACCWDRRSGEPIGQAVVWQCGRAASIADSLRAQGWDAAARQKTGLPLSPYFSAPKFAWLLHHLPEAEQAAQRDALCFGTVDSYLLFRLTEGRTFATDFSNASRTGLLNLDSLRWDPELLTLYGLDESGLPELRMSDSLFGETTLDGLLPRPIPIHGVLGDSHAALFAHRCTEPFEAKVTYGTGSSIMMNAGHTRPPQSDGVVTSLAWGRGKEIVYCLEGNINYTGAVITWLTEDMGLLDKPSHAGSIASSLPGNGGVYLIPAFSGLGAPYFNDSARAAIVGMDRSASRAHLIRAAEECIAYQIHDVVEHITKAAGRPLSRLCADGGPTRDSFLMQFQADVLGMSLQVSGIEELSGGGAAYCAAIGAGLSKEEEIFSSLREREVCPQMEETERQSVLRGWREAIRMVAGD